VWLDDAGRPRKAEWTEVKNPFRVAFTRGEAVGAEVPRALELATFDGKLQVSVTYREPAVDTRFDPAILALTVPQGVEIQDFR
jgi:hypothetical protein